ncbi:hypothetical protein [Nostoc sp.]|uniref:hypothetical protein n=1 Tax=Nostoc sp. TaxID=1180 RepID=UPI002FF74991
MAVHQVPLSFSLNPYQQIRLQRCTRKGFFQYVLSLTKYLLFGSWQHLINFMLKDSVLSPATDSS